MIENVCFQGGGMKGLAYIGVHKAFSELELWPNIKRYIGSSAGAIFIGVTACKIPFEKIEEEILKTDFNKFLDSPWGVPGEGIRLLTEFGLYKGDYFYNWYGDFLEKTIGNKKITFKDIYDEFGNELIITATDISTKRVIYFNHIDHPSLELRDAVRMSMSIPVLFKPIKVKENNNTHLYVDGGVGDNFPLTYFDHLYKEKHIGFHKTIGFDIENMEKAHELTEIKNIIDLVIGVMSTTIEVIETNKITEKDKERIIKIDTFDINPINFDIKKEDIDKLILSGYNSTMNYFKK